MKKKLLSLILIMTMLLSTMTVLGAGGDGTADDDMPPNPHISNADLAGEYTVGTIKEFIINTYSSGKTMDVQRELSIIGPEQVNDLQYKDKSTGEWLDISGYNTVVALANDVDRYVRATFNKEGIYRITFSLTNVETKQTTSAVRYATVKDGKITVSVKKPDVPLYTITIDGKAIALVEAGMKYTLPKDAKYGYYMAGDTSANDKMYRAGSEIEVSKSLNLTSVNELSLSVEKGAGIRVEGTAGIRFQANISSDNMKAIEAQSKIVTGMLITADDIYRNKNSELDLTKTYTMKNIINRGWYNKVSGTYCGSIINIAESNYIRKFIARAYAVITYEDSTTETIYSEMTEARSIQSVAQAVQKAGYPNLTEDQKKTIDNFAK